MNLRCFPRAAVASALLLGSCGTVSLDETDRDALSIGVRVEKRLSQSDTRDGSHLELEWRSVDDDTDELDYSIETLAIGFGVDRALGEDAWIGAVGGLAWQAANLDTAPDELEDLNGVGPYFAVQGGWFATPWFEPCVRAGGAIYFPNLVQELSIEAGARMHPFDHASLFVGWRQASYDFEDFDSAAVGFDSVGLDVRGLVVMLQLGF